MARSEEKKGFKNHQISEFGFPYVAKTIEGWLNILVFIIWNILSLVAFLFFFGKKIHHIWKNRKNSPDFFCLCLYWKHNKQRPTFLLTDICRPGCV
jgi:hypothetical protein